MKRFLPVKLFSMVGLLLALVALMLSCTGGCCPPVRPRVPERSFTLDELLVDESAFPSGWQQQGLPDRKGAPVRLGIERIGVGFMGGIEGVALHQIYQFEGVGETTEAYQELSKFWFSEREGWTSWSSPTELSYQSSVADRFRLGCYTHRENGIKYCQAVGQYDEYIVRFHTYMSPGLMTYTDLEHVLQVIDERMAHYLSKEAE